VTATTTSLRSQEIGWPRILSAFDSGTHLGCLQKGHRILQKLELHVRMDFFAVLVLSWRQHHQLSACALSHLSLEETEPVEDDDDNSTPPSCNPGTRNKSQREVEREANHSQRGQKRGKVAASGRPSTRGPSSTTVSVRNQRLCLPINI
jgi:hypothetical protein